MEVLVNGCYGGWGISSKAVEMYKARTGKDIHYYDDELRTDPILISIIEELGEEGNGEFASLSIDEVPDGYEFWIEDYDGIEDLHWLVNEDYLRKLIREGNEDKIVEYVLNAH